MLTLLNFRIDQTVKESLADLAKRDDRSLSNYLRRLLARHVAENATTSTT